MHWSRIVGIGLLVLGLVLLFLGWQASQGMAEEIHETLTGRFTDDTQMYFIGGAVSAVVGLVLLMFGVRR
jgi:ascorbate-specific PTS system EIIC-type component UlaA